MLDIFALDLIIEFFSNRAKKKYYLSEGEITEQIREQSLCSLNKKSSSLLVLTDLHLIFFNLKFGKRTLSTTIPIQEITKCKRDFWSNLIVETNTEQFLIRIESPKKWEKIIRTSQLSPIVTTPVD